MKTKQGVQRAPFSLYLRNGVYYARLWDQSSRKYTNAKSTGERDERSAAIAARRMLDEDQFKPRATDPIVSKFLFDFWQNPKKKLSFQYRRDNLNFVRKATEFHTFANLRLSRVTTADLNRLRDFLENVVGYTPRLINRSLQAVCVPLRWAYTRGHVSRDPTVGVEKANETVADNDTPKVRGQLRERGVLSLDEIDAVLSVPLETRYKAAIALAALAGLRRGEVRGLLWEDVDLERKVLRVRHNFVTKEEGLKAPKARSVGRVEMVDSLVGVLRQLQEESPYQEQTDFVVYQENRHTPMSDSTLKRVFVRALEAIGIGKEQREERNLTYHGLRHFFATQATLAMPEFVAAKLTRQKNLATLKRYQHVTDDVRKQGTKALNKRMQKVGKKGA